MDHLTFALQHDGPNTPETIPDEQIYIFAELFIQHRPVHFDSEPKVSTAEILVLSEVQALTAVEEWKH